MEITNMDDTVRDILDTWLKFGTAFLIHRLGTYYLLEKSSERGNFFNKDSLQLGIFVLLGFTLYFLLVKPFVPQNLQHPILREMTNDILFYGSGLLIANVMYNLANKTDFNPQNFKSIVYVLFGFVVYDVLIYRFVPRAKNDKDNVAIATNDVLKFGIMLTVAQALNDKSLKNLANPNWLASLLFVLTGFALYDIVIRNVIVFN